MSLAHKLQISFITASSYNSNYNEIRNMYSDKTTWNMPSVEYKIKPKSIIMTTPANALHVN